MLAKIKKVKFEPVGGNDKPHYKVLLECSKGNHLFIHFDYTSARKKFIPLLFEFRGENKGARLDWYAKRVENMTVDHFLEKIAEKVNKKYNYKLH